MFSHAEFNALLDQVGPAASHRKERLALIDEYDCVRKKIGIAEAERHFAVSVKRSGATLKLENIADQLQDFSAQNRIKNILRIGNDSHIFDLSKRLDQKIITDSVRWQGMTEERIRRLAAPYSTPENPTGHLPVRRHARRQAKQATARLNMHLGMIGGDGYQHVSPHEISLRNQQKARWLSFGEKTVLRLDDQEISMADVMQSANRKKIAEIYTLSKGLESYAKRAGLTWAFITLTAPGNMHPNPSHGENSWDGTEPDTAHRWIHKHCRRALARLRKQGIIPSGVRVCEPHKDGCPHWHLLIFTHPSDVHYIEAEFRKQPEWNSEQGMKFVLDNGKASAASYLFKYVLKAVSSLEKLEGEAGSVDAWRSTWAIRSFQWLGMPPLGLWRRLRQIKECPADEKLAGIWRAVHRGDAHAFIGLAGGLNVKAKDRPIHSKTETHDTTKTILFFNYSGPRISDSELRW